MTTDIIHETTYIKESSDFSLEAKGFAHEKHSSLERKISHERKRRDFPFLLSRITNAAIVEIKRRTIRVICVLDTSVAPIPAYSVFTVTPSARMPKYMNRNPRSVVYT